VDYIKTKTVGKAAARLPPALHKHPNCSVQHHLASAVTADMSGTKAVIAPSTLQLPACLHAGAGKTLVAAEVIRRKLPALKAATKAVLFMAPTNPLVAQVCTAAAAAAAQLLTLLLQAVPASLTSAAVGSWLGGTIAMTELCICHSHQPVACCYQTKLLPVIGGLLHNYAFAHIISGVAHQDKSRSGPV
jgi:hypothetical protein